MSLRVRIILVIALVLVIAMALGTVVAGYEVRRALAAELSAGLGGGRQTVLGAFKDLPQSDHPSRDLHELVGTFDGNRHVRATLLGAGRWLPCRALAMKAGPLHRGFAT